MWGGGKGDLLKLNVNSKLKKLDNNLLHTQERKMKKDDEGQNTVKHPSTQVPLHPQLQLRLSFKRKVI